MAQFITWINELGKPVGVFIDPSGQWRVVINMTTDKSPRWLEKKGDDKAIAAEIMQAVLNEQIDIDVEDVTA